MQFIGGETMQKKKEKKNTQIVQYFFYFHFEHLNVSSFSFKFQNGYTTCLQMVFVTLGLGFACELYRFI